MPPPRQHTEQTEVQLTAIRAKYRFLQSIVEGFFRVAVVVSYSVPLFVVYKTVEAVAGRTTIVSPTVGVLVTAMVGGSSGLTVLLATRAKRNKQTDELLRLRARLHEYEKRLGISQ